ncbi:MAG: glycosyltransferase family 4 protein [Candidatus Paceibacterota bacterium]
MGSGDERIRVLMFGWEFPPFNSGGLGVACLGLTKAIVGENAEIIFVLPKKIDIKNSPVKLHFADSHLVNYKIIDSLISPYLTEDDFLKKRGNFGDYGMDLIDAVKLYALRAREIAKEENFNIIHAHDWLSFGAGIEAKKISGKPLIVHIHSTEFDRTGGTGINNEIYLLEKQGMEYADAIIAVSNFTKDVIISKYGIPPEKIQVVHNGIENKEETQKDQNKSDFFRIIKTNGGKIVIFVGRITIQKGPDYFLKSAKKVLEFCPNTFFIVAGSGDMQNQIIRQTAQLGISDRVLFSGFLRDEELNSLYKNADLFIMPSVSEPFGLTALEAMQHGTPVIVSKQSGVSEVVNHALKVDFWDTDELTNKIVSVLKNESLSSTLKSNSLNEVKTISWKNAAQKCVEIYKKILGQFKFFLKKKDK